MSYPQAVFRDSGKRNRIKIGPVIPVLLFPRAMHNVQNTLVRKSLSKFSKLFAFVRTHQHCSPWCPCVEATFCVSALSLHACAMTSLLAERLFSSPVEGKGPRLHTHCSTNLGVSLKVACIVPRNCLMDCYFHSEEGGMLLLRN